MQILKDNIRSRILDVAKQQFELKGYSKTSMREIAVDVGVGVGNIYNYFKSKDELFHEVVRPVLYALEMLLQEHHGIQGEDIMMMRSEEYLETCINEYISLYDTHHRLMKILYMRQKSLRARQVNVLFVMLLNMPYPMTVIKSLVYIRQIFLN